MRWSTFTTVLALLAIPSLASAHAGNDNPNVVHACVGSGSDLVRIVGVTGSCRANETPAHWDIQGPQGVPGINGTNGTNGTDGTNGINGTNGIDGKDGATGPAGPVGPTGPAGADCLPTNPACVGPQGETGPQGPQGPQGAQGATGNTGAQGPPGPASVRFWALVATDAQAGAGVLNSNSNLITATRLRAGSYRIGFPQSLEFCGVVVNPRTPGGFDAGSFIGGAMNVTYGPSFFGGTTHTESLDVQVVGLGDGLLFTIVVYC